jgi:hypothetical protein
VSVAGSPICSATLHRCFAQVSKDRADQPEYDDANRHPDASPVREHLTAVVVT